MPIGIVEVVYINSVGRCDRFMRVIRNNCMNERAVFRDIDSRANFERFGRTETRVGPDQA